MNKHLFIKIIIIVLPIFIVSGCALESIGKSGKAQSYDVVVYGGTSGGVIAAVQASRMGKSVILI